MCHKNVLLKRKIACILSEIPAKQKTINFLQHFGIMWKLHKDLSKLTNDYLYVVLFERWIISREMYDRQGNLLSVERTWVRIENSSKNTAIFVSVAIWHQLRPFLVVLLHLLIPTFNLRWKREKPIWNKVKRMSYVCNQRN